MAFARAFELPVTWFFMPPPAWAGPGMATRLDVPDAPALGETVALLVDLVFGDKAQQAMLAVRLDAFLGESGAGVLTAAQARITALGRHKVEALVRQSFQDLGRWQTSLRSLANQLEDLEVRAKRAVAADAGIDPADLGVQAPPKEPAWDVEHLAGTEAEFISEMPADVEGGQPVPPDTRKHPTPSPARKSTRRKS